MADWKKFVLDGADKYGTQTGAGTIDPENVTVSYIVTTGSDAIEVSAGSTGQYLFLIMKTDGGTATLLGSSSFKTYASVTMDDVGDWLCVQFDGREWVYIAHKGCTLNAS